MPADSMGCHAGSLCWVKAVLSGRLANSSCTIVSTLLDRVRISPVVTQFIPWNSSGFDFKTHFSTKTEALSKSFHQITIQKWNPILSSWKSVIEHDFLKRVASSDQLFRARHLVYKLRRKQILGQRLRQIWYLSWNNERLGANLKLSSCFKSEFRRYLRTVGLKMKKQEGEVVVLFPWVYGGARRHLYLSAPTHPLTVTSWCWRGWDQLYWEVGLTTSD